MCVPIDAQGHVDPRWGRAARVAIADVRDGHIESWQEHAVAWDRLHDAGPEGTHHARVARFLQAHRVEIVVAHHMGEPMRAMLENLGVGVRLAAAGDARRAITAGTRVQ